MRPLELIDATCSFELDHETFDAGELPDPVTVVADACTEVPDLIGFVAIEIDSDDAGPVVEDPDPPHPAKTRHAAPIRGENDRIGASFRDAKCLWQLHHKARFL